MWIFNPASNSHSMNVGDRTAHVGCSDGRWYWYVSARHRIFSGDWAERENNRVGNAPVMFHDGPPATLDEWRGTAIAWVSDEAQARNDAQNFIMENV